MKRVCLFEHVRFITKKEHKRENSERNMVISKTCIGLTEQSSEQGRGGPYSGAGDLKHKNTIRTHHHSDTGDMNSRSSGRQFEILYLLFKHLKHMADPIHMHTIDSITPGGHIQNPIEHYIQSPLAQYPNATSHRTHCSSTGNITISLCTGRHT